MQAARTTSLLTLFALVALAAGLAACGGSSGDDVSCGPGTERSDGLCVPLVSCGEGTIQENNRCVIEDGISCGAGTVDNGSGSCVPSDDPCGADTVLDEETGQCVSASVCASGTVLVDGECVVEYEMVCGEGTVLDEAGETCLAACGAGLVYDATSDECVSECGDGTTFSETDGVCVSACSETEYYVDGIGCVHVPECGPGSAADPESEDCEGFPFDELTLDTICARAATNFCAARFECCNSYGFTRLGVDGIFGFPSDESACIAITTDLCERGPLITGASEEIKSLIESGFFGVAALRRAVEQGAVIVDEEALAAFDELFGPEQGCSSVPVDDEDITNALISQLFFLGIDPRLIEAVQTLVEPNLRPGDDCSETLELGVNACISGRCLPSGATFRCVSRIPATTYTGDGEPEPTEICSRSGDANQCAEDTQCSQTFFGDITDELSYMLCVPPKAEGERCEEFATINPCDEGLVCRREGRDAPRCAPLGTEGDQCREDRTYDTCAAGHYCDRELAGALELCFPFRERFESCDEDRQCTPGDVCRPPDGWEDSLSLPAFSCRPPVASGVACAAESEYATWCGPERFCSDAANTCEDNDDCAADDVRVGNCRPAREIGQSCDICAPTASPLLGLTGCAQGDFCFVAGDDEGEPTPVCQDGISICDFGIAAVSDLCPVR